MKIAVFNTKNYDKEFLSEANKPAVHELVFLEPRLTKETVKLAQGFEGVCVFVNDQLDRPVVEALAQGGVRLIALRCAGFNNVDLHAAQEFGIKVLRVPAYSPYGVAEHAVALILALNRRICRAYNRVHEGNFLLDGLMGFELKGKTVGVMGTGKIGTCLAGMMKGFGCEVLGFDENINPACEALGVKYVSKDEIYKESDIISLHLPLTPATRHIIDEESIGQVKPGVMLINTSRGGLIDTAAVVAGLKSGRIGYLGLDVYEEEGDLFFKDLSGGIIQDDVFARLLTFSNVIITAHQAFFTLNALTTIAQTTMANISGFSQGAINPQNEVTAERVK